MCLSSTIELAQDVHEVVSPYRDLKKGGAGGAIAPPHFDRIEGAAGQRRRAALLLAPQFEEALKAPAIHIKLLTKSIEVLDRQI
jgi:hypothetical protein